MGGALRSFSFLRMLTFSVKPGSFKGLNDEDLLGEWRKPDLAPGLASP
jgi:hypothetical protein